MPDMSTELHSLTDSALRLDPDERLALADVLIDSIDGPADPGWTEAWTDELHRRSAAADAREVRGSAWADVCARLLRDLAAR